MARKTKRRTLTHLSGEGTVRMVDVGKKASTQREATASAVVRASKKFLDALMAGQLPKGDALATARVAGIMAAKRTSDWIPLCHPLALSWVAVDFERNEGNELTVYCTTRTSAQTGVEMEAMTGAVAAALTVYDMLKSSDKSIEIGPVRLERKSGGRSGSYRRKD